MSHEKAKEQAKNKKEPTKSLKEKRAAKKAKKEERSRQQLCLKNFAERSRKSVAIIKNPALIVPGGIKI